MKTKLVKTGLAAFLLITNFIAFAKDDGGDILGDGTVENGPADPGDAPINIGIIYLVLLGLVFAFYLYKTKKVKA